MEGITFDHLTNPRMLIEFASDQVWERLPQSLLAMAVLCGGLIMWWLIKYILLKAFVSRHLIRLKAIRDGRFYFGYERKRTAGSVKHVIVETIFIAGIVIIFWVAAHVAGFNFWTNAITLSAIGLVATYMFGMALQNMGASYFLYLSDKVEEAWYIEVGSGGGRLEGYVVAIHPLFTDLDYFDVKRGIVRSLQIPNSMLITSPVYRNTDKENLYENALQRELARLPYNKPHNI
jgi:small-conductance mechanosensitive channel